MGDLVEIAAGLLQVCAGLYLLFRNGTPITVGGGEGVVHAVGVYMVGKGVFSWRALYLQAEANDKLDAMARREP